MNELEASATATAATSKALADDLAATKASLAALQSALDETKSAVAAINTQPSSSSGGSAATASLPPDVAARLASLEQDVAALKAQKTGALDKTALTQTLSNLKAKIEAGTSFADESDRIARLLPAASGLDVISAHAAAGLPNAKGLATELAALKPELPTPEVKIVPSEPGIWDRIGEMLSSVITIRDLDAVNWQQVAEKAIAFAEAGDLPQAVGAVDEPEATIPPKLQQWRDRATARLSLETGTGLCRCGGGAGADCESLTMIRMLWRFALLVAAAAFFSWLAGRPGTLTVTWLGRQYEMKLFVAVAIAIALIVLLSFLWSLLRRIWRSPTAAREFWRFRKHRKAYESLSKGIVAGRCGRRTGCIAPRGHCGQCLVG